MTKETPYAGVFVKKADPMVLKDLDEKGLLFDAPKFEHEYPHCWRCDTPLIYYARESWFIKMTAVKDDLIRNNNTVNWISEKDVSVTGLRISRTGVSPVTVTGEHHFRYGSVNVDIRSASEAVQNLQREAEIRRMQR